MAFFSGQLPNSFPMGGGFQPTMFQQPMMTSMPMQFPGMMGGMGQMGGMGMMGGAQLGQLLQGVLGVLQQLEMSWASLMGGQQQQQPVTTGINTPITNFPTTTTNPGNTVTTNIPTTTNTSGNTDPAFLAGLSGNDAYLQRYGGGSINTSKDTGVQVGNFPGQSSSNPNATNGTSTSGSLDTTGFAVKGNDAAIGGGTGANTVAGVQQGIAKGGASALNNDGNQSKNEGSFGDNTVPDGTLNLDQGQISKVANMSQTQIAIEHLWGIQMASAGKQDGGILENVLQNPSQFTTAEVQVATQLANEDKAKYGGITGKSLDQAFFGVYQQQTGVDISKKFENAPIHFATGPVNIQNRVNGANGLNDFENTALIMWGHTTLFGNGINGSLEKDVLGDSGNGFAQGGANVGDVQAMAEADVAKSGKITGDSLNQALVATMQNIYFGGPQVTAQSTVTDALAKAAQSGRSLTSSQLSSMVSQAIAETPASELSQIPAGININDGKIANCPFLNGGGATTPAAGTGANVGAGGTTK